MIDYSDQLQASILIAELAKLDKLVPKTGPRPEAPPPDPASEEPGTRRAGLLLMPKPPPPPEVPAILSPSSVNQFFDCSAKWFYRKVLKLPEERGAALGLGTAVHSALIENFRVKIQTKKDLPVEDCQTLFVKALVDELDVIKLQPGESASDMKSAGEMMTRVYMERAAGSVHPVEVEEPVEGLIGDVPVHGFIDIRDVDGTIIDLKTAKTHRGLTPAYRLQVSTYAMLHPQASGAAQLATLTKTKTVALHTDTIQITPADRKLTTKLYSIARDQMASGIYSPNRSSFLCGKYCSYRERCMADYGGVVEAK